MSTDSLELAIVTCGGAGLTPGEWIMAALEATEAMNGAAKDERFNERAGLSVHCFRAETLPEFQAAVAEAVGRHDWIVTWPQTDDDFDPSQAQVAIIGPSTGLGPSVRALKAF